MSEPPGVQRWAVAETEVEAVQVTAENARAVAEWCGGWACDDLRWNDRMRCYMRHDDDPTMMELSGGREMSLAGAMFPGWGDAPIAGGVMLSYQVPVEPGDWVVLTRGRHVHMADAEFRAKHKAT